MHDIDDPAEMVWTDHFRYVVRVLLSILGQTLVWIASQRALDTTRPGHGSDVVWRPLAFMFGGLWLLSATDSVIANSWLVDDHEDDLDWEELSDDSDSEGNDLGDSPDSAGGLLDAELRESTRRSSGTSVRRVSFDGNESALTEMSHRESVAPSLAPKRQRFGGSCYGPHH